MSDVQASYERAKDTHPTLRASVNRQYKRWADFADESAVVSGWEKDAVGGRQQFGQLTKSMFASPQVLEAGDVPCRSLHPALYFTNVPAGSHGENVKADITRAPALFAVTDNSVVVIVGTPRGWMDLVIPRSKVRNPRWITLGGVLVRPKFWCLQYDIVDDEGTDTDTVGLGRGFRSEVENSVRTDVEQALSN